MTTFGFACLGGALAAAILVGAGPARANEPPSGPQSCAQQLSELSDQWKVIAIPANSKPSQARSYGRGGHSHSGAEVTFMRDQIGFAARRCKDGKEHEAMLLMDVVRSILKLSEVQHPAGHASAPTQR